MDHDYYVSRNRKLLRDFDKTLGRLRGLFASRYGDEPLDGMLREARQEYEALIPQLPYLGGKQPFTQFIISTAWYLALYRVLQRRGETVEAVGTLAYQATESYVETYPALLRRVLGHRIFSRRSLHRLQNRAAESRERRYPGDYVYVFVAGDGETFDFGVDYVECAVIKFLKKQGAPELAPYICATDVISSDALGWGLMRTMTLAEGAAKCDFRFKKGGETQVSVPEPLEPFIKSGGSPPGRGRWSSGLW